jgi:predicted phage terminase large subunit-like protein
MSQPLYTSAELDVIENFWIEKSQKNFMAFRMYMRAGGFVYNWFIEDLTRQLQQFWVDYKAGKRPILIINTPPQHGKSWAVSDFCAWIIGLQPTIRIIYGSFSDNLGIRCNTQLQRFFFNSKFSKIFPDHQMSRKAVISQGTAAKKNSNFIEFWEKDNLDKFGYFRNTTVQGAVTGETLDIGIIDDPVKGRQEANSPTVSQRIWNWFNDDFGTRFDDKAGLIIIQTRWATNDLTGRILEKKGHKVKVLNYPAIATKDESNRKTGEVLFPELKSFEFLMDRKATMFEAYWEALYQGNPTIAGGNLFKDNWWKWWSYKNTGVPHIQYKFIVADTAQKAKKENDWTIFHCWGYGFDGRIYLLDRFRQKLEAPALRREAELFYRKHDTPRKEVGDPILRGMYIEDKSSGIGLIQELRVKGLLVFEVPRNTDKIFRAHDTAPFVEAGLVVIGLDLEGIDNLTKEAREFPNSEFDDEIDTMMSAVEVVYINKLIKGSLVAAMEADIDLNAKTALDKGHNLAKVLTQSKVKTVRTGETSLLEAMGG